MSSRLQSRLWPKETLVERASAWARKRSWSPITVGSFLKWKQEGLLPRPAVRPLGRGRGTASGWTWLTYRRLLRILQYRQAGLRRWRDIRIALWLDGFDVDLDRVRDDLTDLYQDLVVSLNRSPRTTFWNTDEKGAPNRGAVGEIRRRIIAPAALEAWVQSLRLDRNSESVLRFGLSTLSNPEGQRLAVAFVHQFFTAGPGDVTAAFSAFRSQLPPSIASALEGADANWTAFAGLLAHPDGVDNRLLAGVREASDATLINLRAAANMANDCVQAGFGLLAAILLWRPDVVGDFRVFAPALAGFASGLARRNDFKSVGARVAIIALALSNEAVRTAEGRTLVKALEVAAALANWVTRKPELIEKFEALDEDAWAQIMTARDFPPAVANLYRVVI